MKKKTKNKHFKLSSLGHTEIRMLRSLALSENFYPDDSTDFVSWEERTRHISTFLISAAFSSFELHLREVARESTMFSSMLLVVLAHETL